MKDKIVYGLAIITTVAYSLWRIFYSLPYGYAGIDMFFGILLLIAELVGFLEAANYLKSMTEKKIPKPPVLSEEDYPEVDIFIATYNEPTELLKKTINGCKHLDYPDKGKVHIWLCDDNDRAEMKKLAQHMGIGYFRRDDHKGAKAGNYNNALRNTSAPLIATFDADMIPMHDFLMATVPYFFLDRDDKTEETKPTGFVQIPQSFYNADLFQYNLFSENSVPNEQDFFFQSIQSGRNAANAVIYAGSNTVLSRKALEDVGGFYENAITEDLATGLQIQQHGYQCYALDEVHANGLAPTDIKALFKQRDRWARGCIQTFRQQHLLFNKNLTRKQKSAYIASLLYWYTPLRRVVFLLAPILFSVFDVRLLDCSFQEILIFWLPHYICYGFALSNLSGKKRTTRLSNIYDTILAFALIPGVILESVGIKKEKFEVTGKVRKQEHLSETLKYALPQIVLAALSVYGLIQSAYETVFQQTAGYAIIIFWLVANLYTLIMAIFFVIGRKHYRNDERYQVSLPITVKAGDVVLKTMSEDISESGISFKLEEPRYLPSDEEIIVEAENEDGRYHATMKGHVVHVRQVGQQWRYAVNYKAVDENEELMLQQIIYDRLPTLPTSVNHHSSFFEDIKNNIQKRRKGVMLSQRTLPRVGLEQPVENQHGETGWIKDFNYNYLCVWKNNEVYRETEIFTELETGIEFRCVKEKEAVYKIQNAQDFRNNEEFTRILKKWNTEYLEKLAYRREQEKQKRNSSESEFNEAEYL